MATTKSTKTTKKTTKAATAGSAATRPPRGVQRDHLVGHLLVAQFHGLHHQALARR